MNDDVALRTLRVGDEEAVYTLLSEERVVRHMLFPRFDEARARRFTERFATAELAGHPLQVVRGVTASDSDVVVGLCGLVLDDARRQGEAWYLLRPALWSRGIITRAARALVNHGFTVLGLHRIWASCVPENPASSRVLEKLGFQREGFHRQNLHIGDSWRDSYTYALLRSDWGGDALRATSIRSVEG